MVLITLESKSAQALQARTSARPKVSPDFAWICIRPNGDDDLIPAFFLCQQCFAQLCNKACFMQLTISLTFCGILQYDDIVGVTDYPTIIYTYSPCPLDQQYFIYNLDHLSFRPIQIVFLEPLGHGPRLAMKKRCVLHYYYCFFIY